MFSFYKYLSRSYWSMRTHREIDFGFLSNWKKFCSIEKIAHVLKPKRIPVDSKTILSFFYNHIISYLTRISKLIFLCFSHTLCFLLKKVNLYLNLITFFIISIWNLTFKLLAASKHLAKVFSSTPKIFINSCRVSWKETSVGGGDWPTARSGPSFDWCRGQVETPDWLPMVWWMQ